MSKAKWASIAVLIVCVVLAFFGYRYFVPDPKDAIVSTDPSKWESELAPSLKKLSDEEKRLVSAYLVRRKMAEIFGAKNVAQDHLSVGRMIEDEKAFERDQAAKDSESKALQARVTAEKEAIARQINGVLTVALVSKGFRASDYKSGIISDEITIELALENKGTKDIAGVKGTTVFKDMFGDLIKQISLSYDEGIPAGKSVTWSGTLRYNQFESNDAKLRSIDMGKLQFSFIPDTVIFADGTRLSASPAN